jgi:hypothetical protein
MEIEKLVSALEETLAVLQNSRSSYWANMSVEEIIHRLDVEITRARSSQLIDAKLLDLLFAPTGAIQDTAIDNKWGEEFLRISEIVDRFTAAK